MQRYDTIPRLFQFRRYYIFVGRLSHVESVILSKREKWKSSQTTVDLIIVMNIR